MRARRMNPALGGALLMALALTTGNLRVEAGEFDDLDLGDTRFAAAVTRVKGRSLPRLAADYAGFDGLGDGDAIRALCGLGGFLRMAGAGPDGPLGGTFSAADWQYFEIHRAEVSALGEDIASRLSGRAEARLGEEDLGLQRAMIGTVHLLIRIHEESDDLGKRARSAFMGSTLLNTAMSGWTMAALRSMSEDPGLDEETRTLCGHLYVLHHRAKARLEVLLEPWRAPAGGA